MTSSAIPTEVVVPNLPEFDLGPVQSIQNPICNYSTVEFNCTLNNGCYTDVEYDKAGLCYDCFGDGSQQDCRSSAEMFLLFDKWECDLTGKSPGIYNMTLEIFEDGYEGNNDTITYQYTVSDTNCFNETNPGSVTNPEVNLPPLFTGIPAAQIAQPFCRDTSVVFDCQNSTCYTDPEGDPVYFAIDCDNDQVYERVSEVGSETFYCDFDYNASQNGTQQINIEVSDLTHTTGRDTLAFSIQISAFNSSQAISAGELLCTAPNFYDSNGEVIVDELSPPLPQSKRNAIYRAVNAFGGVFGLSVSMTGWLMIIILAGTLFWLGYATQMSNIPIFTLIMVGGLETIFVLAGVHGVLMIVVMIVLAVGAMGLRFLTGPSAA